MRVVAILILILSCSGKEALINDEIVIIDYKNYDRKEIALLIKRITECNPKLIYVDAFFEDIGDQEVDELLASTIKESNKVVLPYTYIDDSVKLSSHPMFANSCHLQSRRANIYIDPYTYELYNKHGTSVPIDILLKVDSNIAIDVLQDKKLISEGVELDFKNAEFRFEKVDADDISKSQCDKLDGKIVLVGYMGPEKEDGLNLSNGNFVYDLEILALVIAGLLNRK